jgi:hypothetical protein
MNLSTAPTSTGVSDTWPWLLGGLGIGGGLNFKTKLPLVPLRLVTPSVLVDFESIFDRQNNVEASSYFTKGSWSPTYSEGEMASNSIARAFLTFLNSDERTLDGLLLLLAASAAAAAAAGCFRLLHFPISNNAISAFVCSCGLAVRHDICSAQCAFASR